MKRIIAIGLSIGLLLLVLAACSNADKAKDAPAESAATVKDQYPGGIVTLGELQIGLPDNSWSGKDNGFRGISLFKQGYYYRSDPTVKIFLNDCDLEESIKNSNMAISALPDSDFEMQVGDYTLSGNTCEQESYQHTGESTVIDRLYYPVNGSLTLYFQVFIKNIGTVGLQRDDPEIQTIIKSVIELNGFASDDFGSDDDGDGFIDRGTDSAGAEWTLSADGVLTIACTNGMEAKQNSGDYPWHKYLDSVTQLVVTGSITAIPDLAFANLSNLKEASLPDSIQSFGVSCFKECTSLEKINLPANMKEANYNLFCSCESLKEITIPGGFTHINNYDFAYCTSLEKVTILPGVASMGCDAFDGCTALTTLYLPKSVKLIDQYAFRDVPLSDIYYEGSEGDFSKITVNGNNEPFQKATVHYDTDFSDLS